MDLLNILYWIFIIFFIIIPSLTWLFFIILFLIQKRKLAFYFNLFGFLFFGFIITFWGFQIFPGSNEYYAKSNIKEWTGIEFNAKKFYTFEIGAGIHGDGTTLISYYLSEPIPKINLLNLKKATIRGWKVFEWKTTPMPTEEVTDLYDFLLNSAVYENSKERFNLLKQCKVIQKILKSTGNYYSIAYQFRDDGTYFGIEYYILSIRDRRFYYINSES